MIYVLIWLFVLFQSRRLLMSFESGPHQGLQVCYLFMFHLWYCHVIRLRLTLFILDTYIPFLSIPHTYIIMPIFCFQKSHLSRSLSFYFCLFNHMICMYVCSIHRICHHDPCFNDRWVIILLGNSYR